MTGCLAATPALAELYKWIDAEGVIYYTSDLAAVPYLSGVIDQISITDGFPDLSPGFQTTLDGLFITGFASTRDLGPFYGFTKGCPSSARMVVKEMLHY